MTTLHGIALVERVLEQVGAPKRQRPVTGLAALPPSVRAWAARSSKWLDHAVLRGKPRPRKLAEVALLLGWVERSLAETFIHPSLEGDCYPLMVGDEQVDLLYAGVADGNGELPVLTLDVRDRVVDLKAPGFDVWVAQLEGVLESGNIGFVPKPYQARQRAQSKANLGGKSSLALDAPPKVESKVATAPAQVATAGGKPSRGRLSDATKAALDQLRKRRKKHLEGRRHGLSRSVDRARPARRTGQISLLSPPRQLVDFRGIGRSEGLPDASRGFQGVFEGLPDASRGSEGGVRTPPGSLWRQITPLRRARNPVFLGRGPERVWCEEVLGRTSGSA